VVIFPLNTQTGELRLNA